MMQQNQNIQFALKTATYAICLVACAEWINYLWQLTAAGVWQRPLAHLHAIPVVLGLVGIVLFYIMGVRFGLSILLIIPNTVHLLFARQIPIERWTESSCAGLVRFHYYVITGCVVWVVQRLLSAWWPSAKLLFFLSVILLLAHLLYGLLQQWRPLLRDSRQDVN